MEANNTIPANFKPTKYAFNGQPVYKCDGLFVLATGQFVFRIDLEKIEPTNTQSAMNTMKTANLKGMAKHTYSRVMSAIAEDTTAAMLHAFAALTDGAKAIALQSGKFSNLYIRGEHKGMTAEEAAKELTERAAACVSRKLRKIDMICAASFLAEYISRQRKAEETPNPENTPSTMNENGVEPTHAGEIENDMKKFILSWSTTESNTQNPLESVSNIRKPVYSLEFDTYKEAFEAFQKELSATTLTKCCDLDFNPSDHELSTNSCALMVTTVDSEDDMVVQVMESSEYYWIG